MVKIFVGVDYLSKMSDADFFWLKTFCKYGKNLKDFHVKKIYVRETYEKR